MEKSRQAAEALDGIFHKLPRWETCRANFSSCSYLPTSQRQICSRQSPSGKFSKKRIPSVCVLYMDRLLNFVPAFLFINWATKRIYGGKNIFIIRMCLAPPVSRHMQSFQVCIQPWRLLRPVPLCQFVQNDCRHIPVRHKGGSVNLEFPMCSIRFNQEKPMQINGGNTLQNFTISVLSPCP